MWIRLSGEVGKRRQATEGLRSKWCHNALKEPSSGLHDADVQGLSQLDYGENPFVAAFKLSEDGNTQLPLLL